ncbi:putative RNA 2'-O-ribose methyltransferase [Escherichia coli]|uniref:Putative RNA 2'-O-ribose methyltransferase n=1 Tax=Escherichia coli TaxID=562 RepID=A0A376MIP7_ECOLX|nr:putative RNA 2'-O-ribose methyltransferase [Escherichia coli]
MLQGVVEKGGELRVEVADTNESKELLKFCRKFTVPLRAALRDAGVLANYENAEASGCACILYCTRLLLYRLLIQQQ